MITTILNKIIPFKILLKIHIIIITGYFFSFNAFALNILHNQKIQTNTQHAQLKIHINTFNYTKNITNILQFKILNFESKNNSYNARIKKFKKTIESQLYTNLNLFNKHNNNNNIFIQNINTIQKNTFFYISNHTLLQINTQLKQFSKQLSQHIKNQHHITNKSVQLFSQIQTNTKHIINNLKQQIILSQINNFTSSQKSSYSVLKLKKNIEKIKNCNISKFIQLNIHEYNKPYLLYIHLSKNISNYINIKPQISQNIIYIKKTPSTQNNFFPKSIQDQFNINHNLSVILDHQTQHINAITSQQQTIAKHILQVLQTFDKLLEQMQWLNKSTVLKEILRSQISKLPNTPNFQKLNNNITQLQKKRYQCEYQIKKLPLLLLHSTQDDGTPLTSSQKNILKEQITIQNNLIISLLNSYDIQIIELIKLKVSYEKLNNELKKIKQATHRYLFWIVDIYPITTSYPIDIYQDIHRLFTEDRFKKQIKSAIKMIFSTKKTLILIIFSTIISISLYFGINQYYYALLKHSSKQIGKVNQDNFLITFYNIWYSIIIALPMPIFWFTIGYIFSHSWTYPIVVAIGNGINSTTLILWISIISAYFASPQGLFIAHFGWPKKRIQQVFSRHYILSISTIVFLTMALIIFNNYNEQEFYTTLGRLCFITLCVYLAYITNNLKHSKLPLYINKHDSSNNIVNNSLWNIMICAPIIASIGCMFGYFFVAQELLMRLEISLFIWIVLLIIYHLARRWMSIQRRRIAFERAKQKRAKKLAFRTHNEINFHQYQISTNNELESNKNNKKILDLDTINTQSLQLIRSIITLVAILTMTLLWSELHPAFSFLENITLWDVTSTIKGVNNIQPITLNSFLIAILVIIITTKTVHNLPAFLELTLLQHLNLTPGTGYAITTITKYILMLLGSITGFSLIGIEWAKIQWLIAALGVGLGFGLQEIFANFISGLMILFEKPIRIGDTITIRNLTGNVTRINTRATTITDWDHKEIIIPNKEFITKKFTNWSLSDTITRVVLKIPGPTQINTEKITLILLQIAKNSSLALSNPPPEVYLSDLQQGFPIFEIRIYVSDTKLRMPLCHQVHLSITDYYQKNKIELPYLWNYIYKNSSTTTINKC